MLGRVMETFPDKQGLVRVVRLKTKTSIIDRPVTKICLLNEVKDQLLFFLYMATLIFF